MRIVARLAVLVPAVLWWPGCAGASPTAAEVAEREAPRGSDSDRPETPPRQEEARALFARGDHEAAIDVAREVLAESPRAARARAVLAAAVLESRPAGEPIPLAIQAEAEGQSLLAERLAPKDPVVGLLRARVLARIGHLSAAADAAEASLSRAFETDAQDYVELLEAAGLYCHELGEDRRAQKHLSELARRRPADVDAHYRLGTTLLRSAASADDVVQAVREFRTALDLAPDDLEAEHALVAATMRAAEAYAKEGKGVEAAAQASSAAEFAATVSARRTTSARASFDAGVAHEALGNLQVADEHYAEALRRDPEHVPSLLNRIGIAVRARTVEGAGEPVRGPEPGALIDVVLAIDSRTPALESGERRKLEALREQWK